MNLINRESLARGAALAAIAYFSEDIGSVITPSDTIGMVAAILSWGHSPAEVLESIGQAFGQSVADRLYTVKGLFDREGEGGLWIIGPAYDDVKFTHPLLNEMYPDVELRYREINKLDQPGDRF